MKSFFAAFAFTLLCRVAISQDGSCLAGDCTNGMGTYHWDSGNEYTGQWVNGVRTGLGTYDWADGAFYYGNFLRDTLEGKGFYIGVEQGDDRIGIFHEGTMIEPMTVDSVGCIFGNCGEGVGMYLWDSNDIYLGEWHESKPEGYGRYDWGDGSNYIGYLNNGLLDGKGEYIDKDGKSMTGEFKAGEFQGEK
jgi:hypothetical protein